MNDKRSRLEIRLLGPTELTVDAVPLDVDTRKATALLAYLAVADREQSRDHLADLFWPNADSGRSRATLRRTLSALRAALDDEWVAADRTWVRFIPDDRVFIDADQFAADVATKHEHGSRDACDRCIEPLQRAANQLRGSFMEGFALRGCPDFDDWLMFESERYRREASSLFDRLSTALAGDGRYGEAIGATHRWLEIDPLHERAHRMLMLLHAWSGNRSASIAAYRACLTTLERELGVEPLEETVELYEAILDEDAPRAPSPPSRPTVPSKGPASPFVGRGHILDRLRPTFSKGHGLIVLEGEMGVGKSRLLDEITAELSAAGAGLAVGRAYRTESGVAYGPVQAALSEGLQDPGVREAIAALPAVVSSEAARLLPALGPSGPADSTDPTAKARFLDGLARVLGVFGSPSVLAIDNLHWADSATLELLAYLARRLEQLGVILILTRRPEDTPADHPVALLVEEIGDAAEVVRLERFTAEAVAELVRASGVEGIDAIEVFERTRGLPFFVVEFLEAAKAGRTDLPVAIRRLLLGRLNELDDIGRQIVTAVSVIGTATDFDTVRAVSGRSEDEVLGGLDDLVRRGMLREPGVGVIDFTHEQLREVAYDETTMARRRLLHRRAATHLRSTSAASRDPHMVAAAVRHHLAAGEEPDAAALSVSAGDLAVAVFAPRDALGHYELALALDHPDRGAVHRRIGDVRTRLGEYGSALAAYEAARTAFDQDDRTADAARAAHAIGEIYRRMQRWEMAVAAFEESWNASAGDAVFRSRLASDWAFVLHRLGESEARGLAETALALARESEAPDALAHALNLSALLEPDTDRRIAHLEQALAHAADPMSRTAVLNNLALAHAANGDIGTAISTGQTALDLAEAAADRHRLAALHDNLADFLHRAGDEEAAMESLKTAVALFAEIGMEPGSLEPEVWLLKEW